MASDQVSNSAIDFYVATVVPKPVGKLMTTTTEAIPGTTVPLTYRCINEGNAELINLECSVMAIKPADTVLSPQVCKLNGLEEVSFPYAAGLQPGEYVECTTSYVQPRQKANFRIRAAGD